MITTQNTTRRSRLGDHARYIGVVLSVWCLVLCWTSTVSGQERSRLEVRFETSEMLSLVYTAQSLLGHPARSPYLREMVHAKRGARPDATPLLREAAQTMPSSLMYYGRQPSIEGRFNGQNIWSLLEIAALQSRSLKDLEERTRGWMPAVGHSAWMEGLRRLDPVHKAVIWTPSARRLRRVQKTLQSATKAWKMAEFFKSAATFYGASWPQGTPIVIGLVPVPGKRANTVSFAHAAGPYGFVEVHENFSNTRNLGVVVHELCHSLYQAQSLERQGELATWFRSERGFFGALAQAEVNEAIATVLGNGIFEERMGNGRGLNASWYNDPIIDGFAKAIAPDVRRYLNEGRTWDQDLTKRMVSSLRNALPNASLQTHIVFRKVVLAAEPSIPTQDVTMEALSQSFRRFHKSYISKPISHPKTIAHYTKRTDYTPVFLLRSGSKEQLAEYPFADRVSVRAFDPTGGVARYLAFRHQGEKRVHVLVYIPDGVDQKDVFRALARRGELVLDQSIDLVISK